MEQIITISSHQKNESRCGKVVRVINLTPQDYSITVE